MPTILFVCTANLFRSPLAAAFTEHELGSTNLQCKWKIASAGTWATAGLPAHPSAVEAAAVLGLDLRTHRSRQVDAAMLFAADLIVVMEQGHKEALEFEFPACRRRVTLLNALAGAGEIDLPDPARWDFKESQATADMIAGCINKGFANMLQRASIPRGNLPGQEPNM